MKKNEKKSDELFDKTKKGYNFALQFSDKVINGSN